MLIIFLPHFYMKVIYGGNMFKSKCQGLMMPYLVADVLDSIRGGCSPWEFIGI